MKTFKPQFPQTSCPCIPPKHKRPFAKSTMSGRFAKLACVALLSAGLAACGGGGGEISVSRDYLVPDASKISYKEPESDGVEASLTSMAFSKAETECTEKFDEKKLTNERKILETIGPIIAGEIATLIVEGFKKNVARELKKHVTSTTFYDENTFGETHQCVVLKHTFKRKNKATGKDVKETRNVLILQVRLEKDARGKAYGMRLRPYWFNPVPFKPEAPSVGKDPEVAIGMAVEPIYFVHHRRLENVKQQVLLTKLPQDKVGELSKGQGQEQGFALSSLGDWSKWPILAGPPTGQISTLEIDVEAATKPPALLSFLSKQLEKNGDALQMQIVGVLTKALGEGEAE